MLRKNWREVIGSRAAARLRIQPVRLRGWRRRWNGDRSWYGGHVLNMQRHATGSMWGGLVIGLSEETWVRLDHHERSHLPRARVLVTTPRGRRVWAHCYRQRKQGPEGRPTSWYLSGVRAGAKSLGQVVARDVEADVARLLELLGASRGRAPRRR